ncbi:acyl-CoA dehydrogenase family protein [Pseudomonas sp. MWU16-30317]|uniref:acyl-CoA dehydrogenase family protein n=1 Tax=Pseudomonas sp. MWU16-30317 TaxID=2878095 RepID=UPI001CFAEE4D|nr:acyl-CoA dehydrogenase family protein [Pseudomonas sp. MWU16-30317]
MNQALNTPDDYERLERLNMIRDSAAAVVPRDGDLSRIRALRFTAPHALRGPWQALCEQGWTGLSLAEARGGSGLGQAESIALLEELGRGLAPEPLIDATLAAALLPADLLAAQLSGTHLTLPAGLHQRASVQYRDGAVSGELHDVALGACADAFVLNTDHGLALVDVRAGGVEIQQAATQDGGHNTRLKFTQAPGRLLDMSAATLQQALDQATLGTAAYLLGCMQSAFERTLDYLKVRRQFGHAIGSFQALQHRCVDLKLQIELSRAIITQAAVRIDEGIAADARQRQVSAAKLRSSRAALQVCREAIQLHGAIGYTDEADIGLFLRKALVLINSGGTLEQHQARYIHQVFAEVQA